jgi:hypothetical protein
LLLSADSTFVQLYHGEPKEEEEEEMCISFSEDQAKM